MIHTKGTRVKIIASGDEPWYQRFGQIGVIECVGKEDYFVRFDDEGWYYREGEVKAISSGAGHPRFYELSDEERTLHGEKNTDYAKGGNPLGNFERVSAIKRLYPGADWASKTGTCIGYILKQLDCALHMFAQGYEGKVETFAKRMLDVSVYSKLSIINKEEE